MSGESKDIKTEIESWCREDLLLGESTVEIRRVFTAALITVFGFQIALFQPTEMMPLHTTQLPLSSYSSFVMSYFVFLIFIRFLVRIFSLNTVFATQK